MLRRPQSSLALLGEQNVSFVHECPGWSLELSLLRPSLLLDTPSRASAEVTRLGRNKNGHGCTFRRSFTDAPRLPPIVILNVIRENYSFFVHPAFWIRVHDKHLPVFECESFYTAREDPVEGPLWAGEKHSLLPNACFCSHIIAQDREPGERRKTKTKQRTRESQKRKVVKGNLMCKVFFKVSTDSCSSQMNLRVSQNNPINAEASNSMMTIVSELNFLFIFSILPFF